MKQQCNNCKFWLVESDTSICRRFPPKVITAPMRNAKNSDQIKVIAQFPPMQAHGWCGEHRDKELH